MKTFLNGLLAISFTFLSGSLLAQNNNQYIGLPNNTVIVRNNLGLPFQQIPKSRLAPIYVDGNSYFVGTGSNNVDSGCIQRLRDSLHVQIVNPSLGGTGIWRYTAIHESYINGPYNANVSYIGSIFNDIRGTNGADIRSFDKGMAGYTAMFVNHFASVYVPGGDVTSGHVTRYGAGWTTAQNATTYGGKQALNAAIDNVSGDSVTYQFYIGDGVTAVAASMIAGDGNVFVHSTIGVYMDGTLLYNRDLDSIADGATVNSHADTRIPYAIIVGGLSKGFHTLKLVNTQSHFMYVDYFATLSPDKPSFIVNHVEQPSTATITTTNVNSANTKLDSLFATFPTEFPAFTIPVNDFFKYEQGMGAADSVHPNNLGHQAIMQSFVHTFDSIASAQSLFNTIQIDASGNIYVIVPTRGAVRIDDFINALNTGSNNATLNGGLNIGYNASITQNGSNLIRGDSANSLNLFIGAGAGNLIPQLAASSTNNTLVGVESGLVMPATSTFSNTGVGSQVFFGLNVAGSNGNTAVGALAMAHLTNPIQCVAVGSNAFLFGTNPNDDIAIGAFALGASGVVSPIRDIAIGTNTLKNIISGSRIIAVGYQQDQLLTTGGNDVSINTNPTEFKGGGGASNNISIQNFVLATVAGLPSDSTAQAGQLGLGKYPNYGFDPNGSQGENTDSVIITLPTSTMTMQVADSNTSAGAATAKNPKMKRVILPAIPVAVSDLSAQSATATVVTFTPSVAGTYKVGGYLDITAIVTNTITVTVAWTDENGTSRSYTFASAIGSTGYNPFQDIQVRSGASTAITVTATATGAGSQTYDAGGTIERLR
jgi:hypothetical protein